MSVCAQPSTVFKRVVLLVTGLRSYLPQSNNFILFRQFWKPADAQPDQVWASQSQAPHAPSGRQEWSCAAMKMTKMMMMMLMSELLIMGVLIVCKLLEHREAWEGASTSLLQVAGMIWARFMPSTRVWLPGITRRPDHGHAPTRLSQLVTPEVAWLPDRCWPDMPQNGVHLLWC